MKKGIIVFIIAALLLAASGLWIFSPSGKLNLTEILSLGVIILLLVFAIFVGYKRLAAATRGEPAEDELSKKVMQKTSSLSFYISLYLWLAIMYFSDKLKFETHTLIAAGILGMAITFAICWLVVNFTGVRNE